MSKVIKPKVKELAKSGNLVVKQMEGREGFLLPKHLADVESVIFIHEGECILHINEEDKMLKAGDAFVIPPDAVHQFKGITDFKGIHIMPVNIRFQFFNE